VILIEIALDDEKGVDRKLIEKQMYEIESLTQYMSNTINDFKNFFSKEKIKEIFFLHESLINALVIIKGTLHHHEIEVELDIDKNISINSHKNEMQQVILVILNNAKDMLLLKEIKEPKIKIKIHKITDSVVIKICDNAGGVPDKIIHKIFEPYYTTKHQTQGTGLGLYISKMIVEDSLGGKFFVNNNSEGACFSVELPTH